MPEGTPSQPEPTAHPAGPSGFAGLARRLVTWRWFDRIILIVIGLAAVVVGLETNPHLMASHGDLLHLFDKIILWVFAAEAALKILAGGRRWHDYFRDPWNLFDFSIVVVCFLPLDGQYAAVLRLARVLRTLRVVSAVPKLQLLVGSLLKSLPSMAWVGLLLGILFYIYAVLGVFLFRANDPVHFHDLPRSMLSLFRVVTLEDWTDIMYTQMFGSDQYPPPRLGTYLADPNLGYAYEPKAMPVLGAGYFVSFVALGTMIMLNLFIGVIINSMDEAQAEQEQRQRRKHIENTGQASLSDELAELAHEVESLQHRVKSAYRTALEREKDREEDRGG
ncbi:MAG: ion transporter [Planctomycetota bacterium]